MSRSRNPVRILMAALLVAAAMPGSATVEPGTTESCMEGLIDFAYGEAVYFAATVLSGSAMPDDPTHPTCEWYPCTIRFYTSCRGCRLSAVGWVETTEPGETPRGGAERTLWKQDPWETASSVSSTGEEQGPFYVDWVVDAGDVGDLVFYHTDVQIHRSGSDVLSPPISITLQPAGLGPPDP